MYNAHTQKMKGNMNNGNKIKENKKSKETSKTQSKTDFSVSGSENKPWRKLLQQRRDELRHGGGSSRRNNRRRSKTTIRESSGDGTGRFDGQATSEMERKSGGDINYKFTLQEIKESIPSDVLRSIIDGSFKPNEIVVITKKSNQSKFIEDLYFRNKKKIKKKKMLPKLPSELFENDISKNKEITTRSILAVYFKGYKKLFGEEDSEWNSKNIQKAEMLVNSLLEDTGTSKIEVMSYIKKILPLWYNRLIHKEDFPDRRPSLNLLFNGKRWYWSNRKLLYRQWS